MNYDIHVSAPSNTVRTSEWNFMEPGVYLHHIITGQHSCVHLYSSFHQ